ncbi:type II toxin-antitoxin system RelE/ParE family toxin [Desulfobulbus sp. F5]|nr:type II toxin-antitoxin system RelE/ParE family toxin [Desulfobulbus sp. F5]
MYLVELMPKAVKDLNKLPKQDAGKIVAQMQSLENGLTGDIKRLTNFTPEYRLRVGSYRVLFEINGHKIVVYRIMHRKEAYLRR